MLGGKDWDKYLRCEGCGERPTQCTCRKDECKIILKEIGICTIVAIIAGVLFGYVLKYLLCGL